MKLIFLQRHLSVYVKISSSRKNHAPLVWRKSVRTWRANALCFCRPRQGERSGQARCRLGRPRTILMVLLWVRKLPALLKPHHHMLKRKYMGGQILHNPPPPQPWKYPSIRGGRTWTIAGRRGSYESLVLLNSGHVSLEKKGSSHPNFSSLKTL